MVVAGGELGGIYGADQPILEPAIEMYLFVGLCSMSTTSYRP